MRNDTKRRKIFKLVRDKKADIVLLQETHASNDSFLWANQWGNKCIFSDGTSQSRGVAIMLTKNTANTVQEIQRDMNGCYVFCKLKIGEYMYCIGNLYAPNTDCPSFFVDVKKVIREMDAVYTILGGDFNVVMNAELDRNIPHSYHNLSHEIVEELINEHDLTDVWRFNNPEKKQFTWVKCKPVISWSRIDYFLISHNLVQKCTSAEIESCILSDHSLISLELELNTIKRGPGYWKFNDKLLLDTYFVEQMENYICGLKRVYSYLDEYEFWEFAKDEIKAFSMSYAKNASQKANMYQFNLAKLYSKLQQKLLDDEVSPSLLQNLDKVSIELNEMESKSVHSAAFRCRCKWEEKGERPSSYFFNLEKRNYLNKSMYITRKADGSLTKDYTEILNVQFEYFGQLYAHDESVDFTLQNTSGIKITDMQKVMLEEEISKDEMFDAVMTLKSAATPGGDGLTVSFYKRFWKLLVDPLFAVYKRAIKERKLNRTARRGIITLIPKKLKDETLVKNWRGITICNNDYKIFAKLIANRLQVVAEDLIGTQQNGFVPGRSIAFNILETVEIVSYLNKKNLPGIVVMVDFEKCFDHISHKAIEKVFQYFGFGAYMVNLIMSLFTQFEVCTINNGYLSNFLVKGRGINQGCNASPLIYTYCGEILNHVVSGNRDIKGVPIETLKNVLSQFADDTGAYLKYEQLTLDAFTGALECVEANMGLRVSYEKTTLYRVGSLKDSDAKLYTKRDFVWTNDPIDTLGVKVACNGESLSENFEGIMCKLSSVFDAWINRKLTLMGKILVVNTLMSSLFVYKLTTLYNCSEEQMKLANSKICDFIWSNKKSKISFEVLTKKKGQGGLGLVDLHARQRALKISWIFKIHKVQFLESQMYAALCPVLRHSIWKCSLNVKDATKLFGCNGIWSEIITAWAEVNYTFPQSREKVRQEIIWWNSSLRVKGIPVCWKHMVEKGILEIGDIVDEDGNCMNIEGVSWLEIRQLYEAIPDIWKFMLKGKNPSAVDNSIKLYDRLINSKNISRMVYAIGIDDERAVLKYCLRWREEGVVIEWEEYKKCFVRLYDCIKITKLRDFQYRLLLKKIVTNVDLFEWNVVDTKICTWCNREDETLKHILYDCQFVQPIINWFALLGNGYPSFEV